MQENELNELLNSPERLFNLVRTFHSLLHLYDLKQIQVKGIKPDEVIGVSDSVQIILKDSKGNIKEVREA